MLRSLQLLMGLAVALTLAASGTAQAHPHVWVIVKSEVVFGPDGAATAVRHHWTFDEMFSTFATQGMDAKKAGGLTREDLAPLAEVNITSLKDFEFFTFAKADGDKPDFKEPSDFWLEQKDGALTLHFTLPFKTPVKAKQLNLEIYDSSYFVDFSLVQKDPVAMVDAPAACKIGSRGARDGAVAQPKQLDESFFQGLDPAGNSQFGNRIVVVCP